MKTHAIAIDVILQSPLHISSMEEARYMPGEQGQRKIRRTSERVGIPVTLTREMEVPLPAPITVGEGEAAFVKTTARIPVMPTNGLGGHIRRSAMALVAESMIARGMTLTPRAYNTLSSGAADASLQRSEAGIDQVIAGKLNPFFGVFGGTSYALSSDLVVHDGYPICEATEHLMSIPAMVQSAVRENEMTLVIPITKKDDIMDMRKPDELSALVGIDAVAEYTEGIMRGREAKTTRLKEDAADQGKKTELSTVAAVHAVAPGVHFALRFELTARTPAHLGVLLLALQRFCNEGQHGGKAAKGYGRFASVHARLFEHKEGGRSIDGITMWERSPTGEYNFTDHPSIQAAVNAGEAFYDGWTSEEVEKFASANASKLFKGSKVAA